MILRTIWIVIMIIMIIVTANCGNDDSTSNTDPSPETIVPSTIPSDFQTYTDKSDLFSISYPPSWVVDNSILGELETLSTDYIESIRSGAKIADVQFLFLAGIPIETGYHPNVNILVESVPPIVKSLDGLVASQVMSMKFGFDDFKEISRETISVGTEKATLIEYTMTLPDIGEMHNVVLLSIHGDIFYTVTCSVNTYLANFSEYEADIYDIQKSFRIH